MTKKKTKTALAVDQEAIDKAFSDLDYRLSLVQGIADVWNQNKLLPRLDRSYYNELIRGGTEYMESLYQKLFTKSINEFRSGLGDAFGQNRVVPQYGYDRAKFSRYLKSIDSVNPHSNSPHVNSNQIDFDENGNPFIPESVKQSIRDACTAYATEDNQALIDAAKTLAEAANKVHAVMAGKVTKTKLPMFDNPATAPLFISPPVVETRATEAGTKSLAAVKYDRVKGEFFFNPWSLTYGDQDNTEPPLPPPPPPPPIVEPDNKPPTKPEYNPYKVTRINRLFDK